MTRLDKLCLIHRQQGGTIHQFNEMYKTDFLAMPEKAFEDFCKDLILQDKKGKTVSLSTTEIDRYEVKRCVVCGIPMARSEILALRGLRSAPAHKLCYEGFDSHGQFLDFVAGFLW